MLYQFSIFVIRHAMRIAALFNAKAKLFVAGRTDLFSSLAAALQKNELPIIWIHCASVGEFEQARPIMERFKAEHANYKIFLTFFSPSGYELRKAYSGADYVFYLPWDTRANAAKFVNLVRPTLAIFIKYEFWKQYVQVLKSRNIPILSVSSIFRPEQAFFAWYGNTFRGILKNFTHFFVQNSESKKLLSNISITNVTVAGDTRFDRVHQITQSAKDIPLAAQFKNDQKLMVVGSCWDEDLDVLAPFIHENAQNLKFIIAPHEINEAFLQKIEKSIQVKSIRFSRGLQSNEDSNVLIIDNIGLLSTLYRYGEFAYVGGAFGKGLHNILEAASYGIPIFFGNKNYTKFQEAIDLIMQGGAFEVADYSDLKSKYELLSNRPENFLLACDVTKSYVQENLGATDKIMNHCKQYLQKL